MAKDVLDPHCLNMPPEKRNVCGLLFSLMWTFYFQVTFGQQFVITSISCSRRSFTESAWRRLYTSGTMLPKVDYWTHSTRPPTFLWVWIATRKRFGEALILLSSHVMHQKTASIQYWVSAKREPSEDFVFVRALHPGRLVFTSKGCLATTGTGYVQATLGKLFIARSPLPMVSYVPASSIMPIIAQTSWIWKWFSDGASFWRLSII